MQAGRANLGAVAEIGRPQFCESCVDFVQAEGAAEARCRLSNPENEARNREAAIVSTVE